MRDEVALFEAGSTPKAIDFIVSGPLSGLGTDTFEVDLTELSPGPESLNQSSIRLKSHFKKMHYRPTMLATGHF